MSSIATVSGSALRAFSTGIQAAAQNMAGVNRGAGGVFRTTFQENGSGGVSASVSAVRDQVDISEEAVSLLADSRSFKANLTALKTSDEMTKQLLSIKA